MPPPRLRVLVLWAVAAGLLGLSVTGCVRLLEPRASDATYYLLGDAPQPDARPNDESPTDTTGLTVGLRQPRLAAYLDATRIVTRRGPHEIQFSEFHRWGEDLDRGIGRRVATGLEAQPGIRSAEVVPWSPGATFDFILQLHVLRFEGVGPPIDPEADEDAPPPKGHSRVVVQWTLLHPEDETVLARHTTRHEESGWSVTNYSALVSRLGTSLDVVVDDITTRLQQMDRS